MSSTYKIIFYSAILILLFPVNSHADIKIYLGAPAYNYKHNYYPQNNFYNRNYYNKKYYTPYSNYRYKNLSNLYKFYGNKHAYDRANYYRNKYNKRNNKRRHNNAYTQGYNDRLRFNQHKRNNKYRR